MKINFKLMLSAGLIFASILTSQAQESPLKVTYRVNTNKSVDFDFQKTDPGTHTIIVTLRNLTNSNSSLEQISSVNNYSGNIFSLTPSNKDQGIGFSYSYTYIRGKLKPKYNADFAYILPYKVGRKTRAVEVGYANAQYFGSTTPDDWKVYRFYTKTEDTVTAVRKGIVVEVKDLYETKADSEVAYTSQTNTVAVEHADGTIAYYKGFKKGSIPVKVGDVVFPGSTLGLNTKMNANSSYNVSLMINYLKSADVESTRNQNMKGYKSLYGFVTPHFYTATNPDLILVTQQEYEVVSTPAHVQKEMSKKELKQAIK